MAGATAKTPKYKAKKVFWNTITQTVVGSQFIEGYRKPNGRLDIPNCIQRFDSQHEFKVYLELVRMYGDERVFPQYPIEIVQMGSCYPNGKTWKIDFAIREGKLSYLPNLFVEAKGAFLPEFAFTLAACEAVNPAIFDNLHIVFSDKIPTENRVIKNLLKSTFKHNLMTLKQLKDSIKL